MSEEIKLGPDPDAWFKELQNRLDRAAARLGDAAVLAARFSRKRAELDPHLSHVQELIAKIEDRLATLVEKSTGRAATPVVATIYRDVAGFPGYRVGSDGSVWGSRRAGRGYGRSREWRQLKPYLVRPGPAPTVSLYRDRVRHPRRVDAVVLLAFEGLCPEGHEVEHKNGDPLDNRAENLRYVLSRQDESCTADAG